MPKKPKLLFVGDFETQDDSVRRSLEEQFQIVTVANLWRAVHLLRQDTFDVIHVLESPKTSLLQISDIKFNSLVLESMPDGVVLLDAENKIVWHNACMQKWCGQEALVGKNFYGVLASPEILGPDFCPLHTAFSSQTPSNSTLRTADNRYFHIHAVPTTVEGEQSDQLIVTVRDVTTKMHQQQKMEAIQKAGMELADLKPEELKHMSVDERIELLKSNIVHFTGELLHYDVMEIRLIDRETGRLEPLLAVGIEQEAAVRELYAQPQGNGVTGFVAATGKSYLCENTSEDPLYLLGARDAKSSITVPLISHDEMLGTFNVESPDLCAFDESDLQFLERFSSDVAAALGTLELLVAEKATTAAKSVEAIHTAVALPIDDILNETVNVMERYIGHEPEVVSRLESILRNARDIKQVIQKVGQAMTPSEAVPQSLQTESRPLLNGRRILVADADENVRVAAHALLERYQCAVETSHDGVETLSMVRNITALGGYDLVLADIRLPDMNGYELMQKLAAITASLPLVLMTGFGYDPGHSIVKARQAGLKEVLYKPFRLDQLLETIERVLVESDVSPSTS
ncbi:MAG: response regulator [Planctomycetota bacterium]|nr:response regulator [Planctomycetota bacterium]